MKLVSLSVAVLLFACSKGGAGGDPAPTDPKKVLEQASAHRLKMCQCQAAEDVAACTAKASADHAKWWAGVEAATKDGKLKLDADAEGEVSSENLSLETCREFNNTL